MDAEQRKSIIREIEHWRRSKLLPEHYCDFLLNLYLEDHASRGKGSGGGWSAVQSSNWKIWMVATVGIAFISLFALNFTSFQLPMQISISTLLIAALYMFGAVQRSKQPLISFSCFGLGSVLMLYIGLFLLKANEASSLGIVLFMAVSSIVWMVAGIAARFGVLHFCGWMVLLLTYGWFLQSNLEHFDWLALQMGWLPASVVLIWLGWLFHHSNKQVGAVLLLVGFLTWFTPEAFGFAFTDVSPGVLQPSFLVKLFIAGMVLFSLRKKWIEWVV